MTIRDFVHNVKTRVGSRRTPTDTVAMPSPTPVGHDGLTDPERLELLVQFRATVGAKPAPTAEHRARSEVYAEKLGARPRPRRVG